MNFFKAIIPGALLAWIGASVIGHNGSSGGFLDIGTFMVQGHTVHWSWPLFLGGTTLAGIIFWAMD
jgi:hypothetical protein